jgi:hypothetical protein
MARGNQQFKATAEYSAEASEAIQGDAEANESSKRKRPQKPGTKKRRKYLLTRRTKSEILRTCFEVGYVPYVVPLAGESFRSTAHRITNHRITLS